MEQRRIDFVADGDADVNMTYEVVESTSTDVEGYSLKFKNVKVVGIKTWSETKPEGADASKTYRHNETTIENKDAAIDLIEGEEAQVATAAGLTAAINNDEVKEITLTDNIELTSTLTLSADYTAPAVASRGGEAAKANKVLTIDLNGNTLVTGTTDGTGDDIVNDGYVLTIKNGKLVSGQTAVLSKNGELYLENCEVETTSTKRANVVSIKGTTIAEIIGGSYSGYNDLDEDERTDWYAIAVGGYAKAVINTKADSKMCGGVTVYDHAEVTFEGGTYKGTKWYGLYTAKNCTINFDGTPTFKGEGSDVYVKDATVKFGKVNVSSGAYKQDALMQAIAEAEKAAEE